VVGRGTRDWGRDLENEGEGLEGLLCLGFYGVGCRVYGLGLTVWRMRERALRGSWVQSSEFGINGLGFGV
jgi:hypothetical protein